MTLSPTAEAGAHKAVEAPPSRRPASHRGAAGLRPSMVPVRSSGTPFGVALPSSLRFHIDSGRPSGRRHALTEGDDVYFAPGRYAPGTKEGDRLIAHELAHVAQQRLSGAGAPELAAELDADIAADKILRGAAAPVRASSPAGRVAAYEAWEHRQLGDAYGGNDRRIRLPNGIELTYGQVVALSADFYRSPEALLRAPRAELEDILRVMTREQTLAAASSTHAPSPADANTLNARYELATTGHVRAGSAAPTLAGDTDVASGPHGVVHEGEHIESGAPGAEAGFFALAGANEAHFSPENIRANWIPKHQLALDLAKQAWQARHPGASPAPILPGTHVSARAGTAPPGAATAAPVAPTAPAAAGVATGRPDPAATPTPAGLASAQSTASPAEQNEAQAWLSAGFADHFLTDAFASGHLISGSTLAGGGRRIAQTFLNTNNGAITFACWQCAMADGMRPELAAVVVPVIRRIVSSDATSLLLKTVHDFYNRGGVEVRNALGQVWTTVGDAHLGGSADTIAIGSLASKASRDAVQDVLATGGTTRAEAALDYIPDMARLPGGTFESIAAFSTDLAVWMPVLNRSLSSVPATNDLYQLIKGNIAPMASLKAQQLGRGIQSTAEAAGRRIEQGVEDIRTAPARLEREIERQYGLPPR